MHLNDSHYFKNHYRKYGFGKQLIENSIKWLKQNNCEKILVSVAEGHESVFDYYKKFGFHPRMTYLQLKEKMSHCLINPVICIIYTK